mgnify:CR=1 FL=1
MKRSVTAIALLCMFAVGGVSVAQTQGTAEKKSARQLREEARAAEQARTKGMADVPAIITASNANCQLADATWHGFGEAPVAGTTRKERVDVYEAACTGGPGLLFFKKESATDVVQCVQAARDPNTQQCKLPGNADSFKQLQPQATQLNLRCTVTNAYWIGSSPSQKVDRYELQCQEGPGSIITVPQAGSTERLSALSCLEAANGGYECRFTPREARLAPVAALARTQDAQCQVSDARFVGRDPNNQNGYFEVACAGKPGFMIEARNNDSEAVRSIDCLRAQRIAGGCKLTDVAAASAAASQQWSSRLQAAGVQCHATDFRLIGVETNTRRDVVELKCSDRPIGLVGLFPQQGATSRVEALNCLDIQRKGQTCTLTPKADIVAFLNPLIKPTRADCEVSDFRMIGLSTNNGSIVELACANGRGYIAEMAANGQSISTALPCHISASRGGDRCEIPGNGRAQGTGN